MTPSFGARLRSHRERHGIDLDTIAQNTKIGVAILEGLERDDTSRWPSGIFRRAFLRSYATAVGLDPETTLKEFVERFPDPNPEARVPVFAGGPARELPQLSCGAFGEPPRLTLADDGDSLVVEDDCVHATPGLSCDVGDEPPRMMLADEPQRPPSSRVRGLHWRWHRVAAAACDLVVVIAIAAVVFAVVGMFWKPFTVTTVCYYFAGVLAVGTSPAAWVFRRHQQAPAKGLHVASPDFQPEAGGAETDPLAARFGTRRYPRAV